MVLRVSIRVAPGPFDEPGVFRRQRGDAAQQLKNVQRRALGRQETARRSFDAGERSARCGPCPVRRQFLGVAFRYVVAKDLQRQIDAADHHLVAGVHHEPRSGVDRDQEIRRDVAAPDIFGEPLGDQAPALLDRGQ